MSGQPPVFNDFLVPMTTYIVAARPSHRYPEPTKQDLQFDIYDRILIPYILAKDIEAMQSTPEKIPATKNCLYGRATSDAIQNDDVGLVSFANASTMFKLASHDRILRADEKAQAHAVAFKEECFPEKGFLAYAKGDPLWILKDPVEQCTRTIRSKLHRSPFAVKMANLRTGEWGYVLTTDVQLYPHRKLKRDDEAGLWKEDTETDYIPLPSKPSGTGDYSVDNDIKQGDVFTTPGVPFDHWLPGKPQLVFVINHRTCHYGYVPLPWVRELDVEEQDNWWFREHQQDAASSWSNGTKRTGTDGILSFDYSPPETIPHGNPFKASDPCTERAANPNTRYVPDESGWAWPEDTHRLVEERRKLIGSSEWVSQRVRYR